MLFILFLGSVSSAVFFFLTVPFTLPCTKQKAVFRLLSSTADNDEQEKLIRTFSLSYSDNILKV